MSQWNLVKTRQETSVLIHDYIGKRDCQPRMLNDTYAI